MAGVTLTLDTHDLDKLIAAATALGDEISGREIKEVMGVAMRETIQAHFADIAQDAAHHTTASAFGVSPSGLYERARGSTHEAEVESEGVSVSIDEEGIAQRYFGGDISARAGGFLTIPARGEAYGHRAREFDLKLVRFPSGIYALIDPNEEQHEGSVYYWLVRGVHQQGDPSVLPTDEEILGAATDAAATHINEVWERSLSGESR